MLQDALPEYEMLLKKSQVTHTAVHSCFLEATKIILRIAIFFLLSVSTRY